MIEHRVYTYITGNHRTKVRCSCGYHGWPDKKPGEIHYTEVTDWRQPPKKRGGRRRVVRGGECLKCGAHLVGDNVYARPDGSIRCRRCMRARAAERREKLRNEAREAG